jgi:hypothetical protein
MLCAHAHGAITAACIATGMRTTDYAKLTRTLKINGCPGDFP